MTSFRNREAGVAMTEGLVVCLFFTLVFAGVVHMSKSMTRKIQVTNLVRGCAWKYAGSGCTSMPKECKGVASQVGLASSNAGTSTNGAISALAQNQGSDLGGFVHDIMRKLRIIGEATSLQSEKNVTRPAPLGGGSVGIKGFYSVLCNERSRSASDLMKEAFCSAVKFGC